MYTVARASSLAGTQQCLLSLPRTKPHKCERRYPIKRRLRQSSRLAKMEWTIMGLFLSNRQRACSLGFTSSIPRHDFPSYSGMRCISSPAGDLPQESRNSSFFPPCASGSCLDLMRTRAPAKTPIPSWGFSLTPPVQNTGGPQSSGCRQWAWNSPRRR
ncbi:hypothetical protein VTK73DRAFT_150 [Phialemonium thermophilum]|uniref:Uncharacterized protein n=1 Tax=Phialemonium thermophilum TaxID=223376 RepID=A0ABR3XGB3_9PEZI